MTTAAQRFVELSGLTSATALQHLMAMEEGGGNVTYYIPSPHFVGGMQARTEVEAVKPNKAEIEVFEADIEDGIDELFVLLRHDEPLFIKASAPALYVR